MNKETPVTPNEAEAEPSPSAPPTSAPTQEEDELTRAAREAQAGPYLAGGRFNPPNSLAILGFVLLCIAAGAIYFIYFGASGVARNDQIRLRTLEQKVVDYDAQQRFLNQNGYVPAGPTHKPLTRQEQAELTDLRQRYGPVKLAPPATTPTTQPVGR